MVAARVLLVPGAALAEDLPSLDFSRPQEDRARWTPVVTTGFDSYLHAYSLATTDTTELVAEYQVTAGLEGRSARRTQHRWRVRGDVSYGSELMREQLEAEYRLQSDTGTGLLRLDGHLWGRQFQQDTEYTLSSDNVEGRVTARVYPLRWERRRLDLRGWTGFLTYDTPSTLEVNYRDQGVAAFLDSQLNDGGNWRAGVRAARRAYPDSAAIDRDVLSLEINFDQFGLKGQGLRLYHKSDRRLIADETARPSAWAHWTEAEALIGAGSGLVFLDLQGEIWQYDQEFSAYFDSWRIKGVTGYQWGDIMTATWRLGLANERLDAGDSPETYTQMGLRGAVESYGGDVSGSIMLEYGHRMYTSSTLDGEDSLGDASFDLYSDFNYWEIWVMANWYLSDKVSLDLMVSYEPESHTENADDIALGYGSLRLVWRP